ncbi:MAG TPA: hypothetical protein VD694_06985 [Nitrososphaeraceae archaeon]|nr:hypothetical protein [Nitrososphaeraceae archaeon]
MPNANYHKIKHLVEVDDDILGVFTVNSIGQYRMENVTIAKNANITEDFVNHIFTKYQSHFTIYKEETDDTIGNLRWSVNETDRIRILIIYEKDRSIIVLIKSNISLSESVDNILGYYYEPTTPRI